MTGKNTIWDGLLWLSLAIMWSSSYTVIKIGVETIDPIVLVAGRLWIGAALMVLVLKVCGLSLSRNPKDWIAYAVSGLMGGAIPFLLITIGEQQVDSALASIFMGIAPVATAFAATLVFDDEVMTPRVVLGLVLGFAGIVLLVGPGALNGIGQHQLSQGAILAAALCYAFTTIYVRRYVRRPPLEMASGSMIVAALFMTLPAIWTGLDISIPEMTLSTLGPILYLGLFPTALAHLIYFYLVPRLGAIRMSQVNFAVPVGGAAMGVVILSEDLSLDRILAMAVICTAIFMVTARAARPVEK